MTHWTRERFTLVATVGYALFASVWIFLSDSLVVQLADPVLITQISTLKGLIFIVVTTLLLGVALQSVPSESMLETSGIAPYRTSIPRLLIALTVPFLAVGLQWVFWDVIRPYAWLFMFPAVFLSSWLGGFLAGIVSTVSLCVMVSYLFIPPQFSLRLEHPLSIVAIGVFFGMGVLFSLTHERLRLAERRAADRRLRNVIDQSMVGMFIVQNGYFVYTNPGLCHMLGYASDALAGSDIPWSRLVSPADLPEVQSRADRMLGSPGGDEDRYRFAALRQDGSTVHIDVLYRRTLHNNAPAITGLVIDVTEQTLAAAALRDSEARLKLALTASDMGVWEWHPASGELVFGDEACTITGLTSDIRSFDEFASIVHPADLPRLTNELKKAVSEGTSLKQEFRILPPGQPVRWVSVLGMLQAKGPDATACITGTVRDITDARQLDDQIRQWAAVFTHTQEGVVITDDKGQALSVNHAFTRITGYTQEEVRGENMRMLNSGRQNPSFYRSMWASIRRTGYWQGEIWNRRKNGEVYAEWLSISTVRNALGEVTNYVGVFSDITDIKNSELKLDHLAHHDPLTNLPNRLLLLSRLDHALERCRREQRPGALLFIDLDHFKNVNDSLGHPAGDELLLKVTARMQDRLREADTLARMGGDEFVVLLEDLHAWGDAATVARELLSQFETAFLLEGGQEVFIGASIGISLFPENSTNGNALIQQADIALYKAKASGRNTFSYYDAGEGALVSAKLAMDARLRRALERNELTLAYQPLVRLSDGRIEGVEALLRWQDSNGESISPARFIPLAEETGLILALGDWALRQACLQMRAWLDEGLEPGHIAVNVSPRQFLQPALSERVAAILAETGLAPEYLELELTESAIMDEGSEAMYKLAQLKALGIGLAIDDFGTGYSSLAYLRRFAIDKLKIDQSFVRDIPSDRASVEIASAIIAMARSLSLKVLAEGIETAAQLDFLTERGCDSGQGYLFSRPVDAATAAQLFREGLRL